MRSGKYGAPKREELPTVLGRDVAGTVERCGPGVETFAPGDEVFAMLDRGHGGYAQYATVSASNAAKKPASLDYAQAAAVPLAATTAWQGLFDHGKLEPGQHVLIHGGAGGVGHFAIQFAKEKGATVSTTVSAEDERFARELGADEVIDYRATRFEERVHDVDLVLDLVAGETQERSWAVLKPGGALISTLAKPSVERADDLGARGENYLAQPSGRELAEIGRLIDAGRVRPHVDAVFALDDVAAAHTRLEDEHVRGKIVLRIA